jgi:hypothetical protein
MTKLNFNNMKRFKFQIFLYGEIECSGIVTTNGRTLIFLTINAMARKIFFIQV